MWFGFMGRLVVFPPLIFKNMIWKIAVAILTVLLGVSLFTGARFKREKDLYKNKIKNDFESKYLQLEYNFRRSERQRLDFINRFDSIDRINKSTLRINEELLKEIRKIRGAYVRKNAAELEQEMIRRANDKY